VECGDLELAVDLGCNKGDFQAKFVQQGKMLNF
jgi:hypothetical protein